MRKIDGRLKRVSYLVLKGYSTPAGNELQQLINETAPAVLREKEDAFRRGIAEFFIPWQKTALKVLLEGRLPPVVVLPGPVVTGAAEEPDPFDFAVKEAIDEMSVTCIDDIQYSEYPRYADLLKHSPEKAYCYAEQLRTVEWRERRETILFRDGYRCQGEACSGENATLHVHHQYYVRRKLPWEYTDGALITLCETCHKTVHETQTIPVFDELNGKLVKLSLRPCERCLGHGWFRQWKHVEGGVCFRCRGLRFEAERVVGLALKVS